MNPFFILRKWGLLFLLLSLHARADDDDVYGRREKSEGGLIGIIYDFKQSPKLTSTGVVPWTFPTIIEKFLSKRWDESILNPYFRAARPLYTTQIFIPQMGSDQAPRAFGMERLIQPLCWAVHYKGQISPPEDGVYRFVGGGDDFLAVAINEKLVLYQRLWENELQWRDNPKLWVPKSAPVITGQYVPIVSGDWITLKKDHPVDIDILIGEWPGGFSEAVLLYQKQGVTYQKDDKGNLILPIFQTAPYNTPEPKPDTAPLFMKNGPIWKSYQ